ncbi:MarR family winged helix-turn-helix transcriptional regulator [Azospirillum sp. ST 5-10]|uniref:MarR family winged helix-turn-helix transcriptional regulator n=1 Tax=unclassified Azospirillum TaxID=2630922 RepID=UPI003F4A43C1
MTNARKRAAEAPAEPESTAAGVDGYVLEEQIGHILRRVHQRHAAIFQERIGAAGLTPTQFAAMVKILEVGPLSQNYLGRLAAMDAATMQGVIRRLLERNYVDRSPDPSHGRRLLLALTAEGERVVRGCLDNARAITRETLAPLAPAEQATLLALLRRLA